MLRMSCVHIVPNINYDINYNLSDIVFSLRLIVYSEKLKIL